MRRPSRCAKLIVLAGALAAGGTTSAWAEPILFGPHDVASLFTISKSENKNQVVFAIRLDDQCVPLGSAPVIQYWRMREKSPSGTEPMLSREAAAYGIRSQSILERRPDSGKVQIALNALPDRLIVIETRKQGDRCLAWSTIAIAGKRAFLYDVYAKQAFVFGVDYLLLSGWSEDRTHVVHERIDR